MSIAAGTRLGSYEVVAQIGAGGMGEVYQAHDTKLARDVAIKVLPANFVNDPERLARFQREARMLAALNHANIATIYGWEQYRLQSQNDRRNIHDCLRTLSDQSSHCTRHEND